MTFSGFSAIRLPIVRHEWHEKISRRCHQGRISEILVLDSQRATRLCEIEQSSPLKRGDCKKNRTDQLCVDPYVVAFPDVLVHVSRKLCLDRLRSCIAT